MSWYCSSNFSASNWYIHSHSSLVFSLWDTETKKCNGIIPNKKVLYLSCGTTSSGPTWVLPGSSFQYPEICVFHSGSFSSSLSQSASYHSVFLSVRKWKKNILHTLISWKKKNTMNPSPTHQLLHVASKVETGEGFLLLSIIFCSPLGLLLLLTSSLILKKCGCREKEDQEIDGGI